ncbi:protein LplB [Spirochaetia bacterium]|nr:protein LplB [Spirochaetia bacterium]
MTIHKTGILGLLEYMKWNYLFYLMILPGIVYILLFKYWPMYGIVIAFKDYKVTSGFSDSAWVGLANFQRLFSSAAFIRALKNNVLISIYKLIFGFPSPIILALMINEIRRSFPKKLVQTAVILPNFISWVVVSGLMYAIFSPNTGAFKQLAELFGYKGVVPNLLTSREHFQAYLVMTHIWKNAGMGTIIYLASISGIDQELYEAAAVDGAGRWRQMWHVTLSSLRPTIVIVLIFRMGDVMYAGFDQVYAMSNDLVISVADIIDTYVFRMGLEQRRFSLATAAGLFQSLIGMFLVIGVNAIARRVDKDSAIM